MGLPEAELRHVLENHTFAPRIQRDFIGGVRSGVNGAPSFFVNGQRHDAGYDFPHLAAAIEAQLVPLQARL